MTEKKHRGEALPREIIDRLFAKLFGIYGKTFTQRYTTGANREGVDDGIELAKDQWAEDLAGYRDNLEAIKYALDYLDPTIPPTSRSFRDLCRRAPAKKPEQIGHKPTPEERERSRARAREALAMMRGLSSKLTGREVQAEEMKEAGA